MIRDQHLVSRCSPRAAVINSATFVVLGLWTFLVEPAHGKSAPDSPRPGQKKKVSFSVLLTLSPQALCFATVPWTGRKVAVKVALSLSRSLLAYKGTTLMVYKVRISLRLSGVSRTQLNGRVKPPSTHCCRLPHPLCSKGIQSDFQQLWFRFKAFAQICTMESMTFPID